MPSVADPEKDYDISILRPLAHVGDIFIPYCSGTRTIKNSPDVFSKEGTDGDFIPVNYAEHETPQTKVIVYEVIKNASLKDIFTSFRKIDRRSLTQHQIVYFCTIYRHLLRDHGHATFFLFRGYDGFRIARIGCSGALEKKYWACLHGFSDDQRFAGDSLHRVVVPCVSDPI